MNIVQKIIPVKKHVKAFICGALALHEGRENRNKWELVHLDSGECLTHEDFFFERERLEDALTLVEYIIALAEEKGLDWNDFSIKNNAYTTIIEQAFKDCGYNGSIGQRSDQISKQEIIKQHSYDVSSFGTEVFPEDEIPF